MSARPTRRGWLKGLAAALGGWVAGLAGVGRATPPAASAPAPGEAVPSAPVGGMSCRIVETMEGPVAVWCYDSSGRAAAGPRPDRSSPG
jgi:hypothetical protein